MIGPHRAAAVIAVAAAPTRMISVVLILPLLLAPTIVIVSGAPGVALPRRRRMRLFVITSMRLILKLLPSVFNGSGAAHVIDFLLANGLFNVDAFAFDVVLALLDAFVDSVVIVELDESESAFLPRFFLRQARHVDDVPELREIRLQIVVLDVVFEAADEDLLGRGHALFLSGRGAFRFDLFVVDRMRSGVLTRVDGVQRAEGDESESSRAFRVRELHNDDVDDVAEDAKVLLEAVLGRAVVEATDEDFSRLRRRKRLRVLKRSVSNTCTNKLIHIGCPRVNG